MLVVCSIHKVNSICLGQNCGQLLNLLWNMSHLHVNWVTPMHTFQTKWKHSAYIIQCLWWSYKGSRSLTIWKLYKMILSDRLGLKLTTEEWRTRWNSNHPNRNHWKQAEALICTMWYRSTWWYVVGGKTKNGEIECSLFSVSILDKVASSKSYLFSGKNIFTAHHLRSHSRGIHHRQRSMDPATRWTDQHILDHPYGPMII